MPSYIRLFVKGGFELACVSILHFLAKKNLYDMNCKSQSAIAINNSRAEGGGVLTPPPPPPLDPRSATVHINLPKVGSGRASHMVVINLPKVGSLGMQVTW